MFPKMDFQRLSMYVDVLHNGSAIFAASMINYDCRVQTTGVTMRLKPLSTCSRHSLIVWILTAQPSLQPESRFAESRRHRSSVVMSKLREEPKALRLWH